MLSFKKFALATLVMPTLVASVTFIAPVKATPSYDLLIATGTGESVRRHDAITGEFKGYAAHGDNNQLSSPKSFAYGPDGNLYVLSQNDAGTPLVGGLRAPAFISRFNGTTGAFIDKPITFEVFSGWNIWNATKIRFDAQGRLWVYANDSTVATSTARAISIYTPSNGYMTWTKSSFVDPGNASYYTWGFAFSPAVSGVQKVIIATTNTANEVNIYSSLDPATATALTMRTRGALATPPTVDGGGGYTDVTYGNPSGNIYYTITNSPQVAGTSVIYWDDITAGARTANIGEQLVASVPSGYTNGYTCTLAYSPSDNMLYTGDMQYLNVWKINASTGAVSQLPVVKYSGAAGQTDLVGNRFGLRGTGYTNGLYEIGIAPYRQSATVYMRINRQGAGLLAAGTNMPNCTIDGQLIHVDQLKSGVTASDGRQTMIDVNGDLEIFGLAPGSHTFAMPRTGTWISKKVTFTVGATETSKTVNCDMLNGDIDGDDYIGTSDFDLWNAAFDSVLGDAKWNAKCDLDGDGYIGTSDFDIWNVNFDQVGDLSM